MSALAVATGSINLGQGFPDTDGPDAVKRGRDRRDRSGPQPVPARASAFRRCGKRSLSTSSASTASTYDPDTEVLVTAGATEAIAAAMLALCEPDDEVVTFEPYYDSYAACIALAGARRTVVTLRAPDYALRSRRAPRRAITPRTKLVLLNSPHNPTGKVFTRAELALIAELAHRARPARRHRRGLRAPRVSTASTSRSRRCPGCATAPSRSRRAARRSRSPVGRSAGPARRPTLIDAVKTVKQFLTYVNGGPFQHAIAAGLGLGDDYYDGVPRRHARQARPAVRGPRGRGLRRLRAAGHVLRHHRHPPARATTTASRSAARCRNAAGWWRSRASCSTTTRSTGAPLVRFAFCKRPEVLDEAVARLKALAS